ncbi:hypothetical protein D910_01321, partial [Dendroctonus ponderosae]
MVLKEKAAKIVLSCVILHNIAIAERTLVPEDLGNVHEVTDIQSSQDTVTEMAWSTHVWNGGSKFM